MASWDHFDRKLASRSVRIRTVPKSGPVGQMQEEARYRFRLQMENSPYLLTFEGNSSKTELFGVIACYLSLRNNRSVTYCVYDALYTLTGVLLNSTVASPFH